VDTEADRLMPLERTVWDGTVWVPWQTADIIPEPQFVPGVTMPFYVPMLDFSGPKNVGNLPGVTLTPYLGTTAGGGALTQLPAGTYNNVDFGDRRLDPRGVVTLNNCRVTLTTSDFGATSITAVIQRLNGSDPGLFTMNDCEIHCRAQRIMNGFLGRNAVFNRTVVTGCVDGLDTSTAGSAPQTAGTVANDCWIGDHSWWYYTATGVVHPSDTQSHNDGAQVADTLGVTYNNVFFATWPSEFVGTGTPNSGSDAGNTFAASYIATQSVMAGWRASFLNRLTRADQSFAGVARKTSTGGSWAGVMCNRSNITIDHCWFSGGTVQVNAVDPNLLTPNTSVSVKRSTFWNDMSAGHTIPTSTAKGTAIYTLAGRTYDIPTTGADRNLWFDGETVIPVTT
jgi:hypothetical protein